MYDHPIFDGHNDVLTRLMLSGGIPSAKTFVSGRDGHLDLPRAITGGFAGGFFAVWVPSPSDKASKLKKMNAPKYDQPLAGNINSAHAMDVVMAEASILFQLQDLGALKICTTVAEIKTCLETRTLAAVFHIEGAEAIDPDFHALDVLYHAGLRSLGPVWSRPTIFAEGVPFRFPGSPDTGGGLTELGFKLVDKCNALGVLIDLSHLNEAGFWNVANRSIHPLVATHSNAHAICPHSRNLTDRQLAAIGESEGMVGLNFAATMLRDDGLMRADTPLSQIMRHLDHLIGLVGEDCVGFGSDFDGAVVPSGISDVSGLPKLRQVMRDHGYGDALMKKICHGNWLRVLQNTWEK